MTRMISTLWVALCGVVSMGAATSGAAELVMFETEGCAWCRLWERDIAPIYPKTAEGERAPLRRIEMKGPRPDDLMALETVVAVPTFVLVDGGREIGRLQGYPGQELFWVGLAEMFERLNPAGM